MKSKPKQKQTEIKTRLEYLRGELRKERISQGELCELTALVPHIAPGDVELLEAAGVPETDQKPAQHTPGPWKVDGEFVRTVQDGEWLIARAVWNNTDREKANARLIAAAPELLAACLDIQKQFLDADEDWFSENCPGFELVKIQSAIAKAVQS